MSVHFTCNNGHTVTGQDVYVTGNVAKLGNWDTSKAVKLSPVSYPSWSGWVPNFPPSTQVQWKCIKKQGANVVWQPGANN
ncbi:MAG TPA: carbohydrate-binding module family 20 domain-containing protein, partial [Thermoanaerobaculia bacterium]|nr:carbohydrate-binding module family 20 domain-containing protein [Thermoanaerobaculia bacterium]